MSAGSVIICEFNPLHKGHKYIIDCAGRLSNSTVIAVMSGNFTQRAESAVFDKYIRAEAAVKCGADLVLELPFPWCSAGAEFFAYGGVSIASSIMADMLVFGSESGNLDYIKEAARISESDAYSEYVENMEPDAGAAVVHDMAMKNFGFDLGPNDKLAKEYIRNARLIGNENLRYKAVKRVTVGNTSHKSAADIRKMIYDGCLEDADKFIEEDAMQVYKLKENALADSDRLQEIEYLYFRFFSDDNYDNIFEASGGVGNRLSAAAKSIGNYSDFYISSATKKYTNSRLRRAALFSVMGVTKDMLLQRPLYTLVLAANERGREYLSSIRKKTDIAMINKPSDTSKLSYDALCQYKLASRADELYTLCRLDNVKADEFMRRGPYMAQSM